MRNRARRTQLLSLSNPCACGGGISGQTTPNRSGDAQDETNADAEERRQLRALSGGARRVEPLARTRPHLLVTEPGEDALRGKRAPADVQGVDGGVLAQKEGDEVHALDASPASRALHDRRDEGILASRVRFAIVGMCGCQSVLEVGVCQAILGMVSPVVAEAQALPERPSNLTDVDLVRAAGAERRHPLHQELAVGVRVAFPMEIPDARERLDDCGPVPPVCADEDVDDRLRGHVRNRGAPEMLDGERNGRVDTLPNLAALPDELIDPTSIVRHDVDHVVGAIAPSSVFALCYHRPTPPASDNLVAPRARRFYRYVFCLRLPASHTPPGPITSPSMTRITRGNAGNHRAKPIPRSTPARQIGSSTNASVQSKLATTHRAELTAGLATARVSADAVGSRAKKGWMSGNRASSSEARASARAPTRA